MPWALLLGLVWMVCALPVFAASLDTPKPRQFSVLDGLPSNTIYGLDEDRQGYLWVATRDGLARYDGVGFRVWQVGSGLRDNYVGVVHVDAQDRVWIGTRTAGLAMLDADRRAFRHYDRRTHPQIGSDNVWSIESAPDGALWFGTSGGGLHRLAPDGSIHRFAHDPKDPASLPSDSVGALHFDAQGTLWIATTGGLARWNGRAIERIPMPADASRIDGLTPDSTGVLWLAAPSRGLVHQTDGRIVDVPFKDPVLDGLALNVMLQDTQGNRWLDTRSGLAMERRGVVTDVPLYSQTSRGLVRPQWAFSHEDREGGLWFASSDAGLWYLPANWRDFSLLTRRVDDPSTPANAFVHGVASSHDNTLWLVGSGGFLDRLDPNTGQVQHVVGAVCGSNPLRSVAEGPDRMVWVGCSGMLARVDPATKAIRRWSVGDAQDAAPQFTISAITARNDGTVWLSDGSTLQIRDASGRVLDQVRAGDGRGLGRDDDIRQIATAPDGGVWFAGTSGLSQWNDGARSIEPLPGAPQADSGGFALAPEEMVWTAGMGNLSAFRWDGAELHAVRQIGPEQGMPLVLPAGVAVDGAGNLWAPSARGLLRYDPQRGRLRVYGVRDGLPSQEFSNNPIKLSALGYLALGTADGLLLFHPRQVEWRERAPTLAIASVDVRRDAQRVELPRTGTLTLRPDDRDLRVVARLLSFTNAHAHRYRFRLHGFDNGWVYTGSSGERLLASLSPGRYQLEVQARTADGNWSGSQTLQVRMPPPWWRTAWAGVLFTLAAVALIGWAAHAYRLRLKRRHAWQLAKHQQSMAEQASEAKTRFLATLGHEVRTPMTGVLGMSELLLASDLDTAQRGHVDAIRRAGQHLLRLVNDALDLSRIEAGKLQLESGSFEVAALVHDVAGLMAPLAERRGLAFTEQLAAGTPVALQGDRTRVAQILMNLIGNAIKFTERGFVSLEALPLAGGGGVRFAVTDSGPGLNDEQQQRLFRRFEQAEGARTAARYGGSGLGLAISQELAAAMEGRIDVESTPGKGTRFIVDLPLAVAEAGSAAPRDAAAQVADRTTTGPLKLLLVEDDATVAAVITGLLRGKGHDVVHAVHGLAALAEVATRPFDLGLLDLDLPGIDGLALARQLRAQGFTQPLVAVTARADADAEPLAREAGFNGFLRKPLTGALLAEVIDAVLRGDVSG